MNRRPLTEIDKVMIAILLVIAATIAFRIGWYSATPPTNRTDYIPQATSTDAGTVTDTSDSAIRVSGIVVKEAAGVLPLRSLTPGATNPKITQANIGSTICSRTWSTKSVRDTQSTPTQKATTYAKYQIPKPKNNTGANQTCELDHLISLELGGADSLNNIWPECGPNGVTLNQRYFKMKDQVENYLHAQVCAGNMSLADAQDQIATNWNQVYAFIHSQDDVSPVPYGGTGATSDLYDSSDLDDK